MLAVGFTVQEISDRIFIEFEEVNISDYKVCEI